MRKHQIKPYPIAPGSGKTTLANSILKLCPNFTKISIDSIIFGPHGMYGTDYPRSSSLCAQYQREADLVYLQAFYEALSECKYVVLERSFYAKDERLKFRKVAKNSGAREVLVFLQAKDKGTMWERICKRSRGNKTANFALDISRDTFEK